MLGHECSAVVLFLLVVAAALCLTGLTHIYSAGRGSYGYGYQEILNLKDRFRGFEPSEL